MHSLPIQDLLELMISEANPELLPWHYSTDEVSSHAGLSVTPKTDDLLAVLHQRGLQGCRTQFSRKAFKANVSLPELVSAWSATHSRAAA